MPAPALFPDGHFYSPVCDVEDLAARQHQVWPDAPRMLGVDMDDPSHLRILRVSFPKLLPGYDFPERAREPEEELETYYTQNDRFSWLDARALFVLLQEWRPARIVEVGSGYSSLLMANTNVRFLDGATEITCIEPFPCPFLERGVPGISTLVKARVQDVPLETFEALEAGDILFIDSSHVAKTGSDVNFLYFEVLPRLARGVRVHVHDIFLPQDYPKDWAIAENRSWNEQYVLRALLMYSTAFRVVFGCAYAHDRFPDDVRAALAHPRGVAFGGGSLWIERT